MRTSCLMWLLHTDYKSTPYQPCSPQASLIIISGTRLIFECFLCKSPSHENVNHDSFFHLSKSNHSIFYVVSKPVTWKSWNSEPQKVDGSMSPDLSGWKLTQTLTFCFFPSLSKALLCIDTLISLLNFK